MKFCSATIRPLSFAVLCFCGSLSYAQQGQQEPVELGGTTIIGDRELPIGLYISPWRSADPDTAIDRPSRYLDVGTHALDPEVFKREVEYLSALEAASRRK